MNLVRAPSLRSSLTATTPIAAQCLAREARMPPFSSTRVWIGERPLFAMVVSVLLKTVVPILARVAGHNDLSRNSMSHVMGQDSVCVAMDFPGWMEAATTMFFVTGLVDCWVVLSTMQHYHDKRGRKTWSPLLVVFVACLVICLQGVFLIGVWNPTQDHHSVTVFKHAMPYALMRLGLVCFFLFLLVALRPGRDWKHFMKFHVLGILVMLTVTMAVAHTFWAFSILLSSDANTLDEQAAIAEDMPNKRYALFKIVELASIVFLIMGLLFHPLGWPGSVECVSKDNGIPGTTS